MRDMEVRTGSGNGVASAQFAERERGGVHRKEGPRRCWRARWWWPEFTGVAAWLDKVWRPSGGLCDDMA